MVGLQYLAFLGFITVLLGPILWLMIVLFLGVKGTRELYNYEKPNEPTSAIGIARKFSDCDSIFFLVYQRLHGKSMTN